MVLKIPGVGLRSAKRIVNLRRQGLIRDEHLQQMGVALKRAANFIVCPGQPKSRSYAIGNDPPTEAAVSASRKTLAAVSSLFSLGADVCNAHDEACRRL